MFTDEHDDSQREAEEQLAEYHDFMARPDKRFLVRFITRAEIDAATPATTYRSIARGIDRRK